MKTVLKRISQITTLASMMVFVMISMHVLLADHFVDIHRAIFLCLICMFTMLTPVCLKNLDL